MSAKTSSGPAAKVSDDVQRDQQRDSAAATVTVYGVDVPAPQADEFRTKARMGALAEIRHEKPSVPPSSSAATPDVVLPELDDSAWIRSLDQEMKTNRAAKIIATDKRETAKAEYDLEKLQAANEPRQEDEVEKQLSRLLKIRQMNELSSPNGGSKPSGDPVQTFLQGFQTAIQVIQSKESGGTKNSTTIGDAIALANAITAQRPDGGALQQAIQAISMAKDLSGGLPTTPVGATAFVDIKKLDLQGRILEKREEREALQKQQEAEFARRKEIQEEGTANRVVGLLEKGIETLGSPISRAFGDSMRMRAGLPANMPQIASQALGPQQVQGAPQSVVVQPTTAEQIRQQLQKLDEHEQEVQAVRARLLQQLASEDGPGTIHFASRKEG